MTTMPTKSHNTTQERPKAAGCRLVSCVLPPSFLLLHNNHLGFTRLQKLVDRVVGQGVVEVTVVANSTAIAETLYCHFGPGRAGTCVLHQSGGDGDGQSRISTMRNT
jgi:hypothetical protein